MIAEAFEAKKREWAGSGLKYSQRQLAREAHVSHTYVSLVMNGERRPTEDVVRALSNALSPYLPLDAALAAAGHMPSSSGMRALIQKALVAPAEKFDEILASLGLATSDLTQEEQAALDAERDAQRRRSHHQP